MAENRNSFIAIPLDLSDTNALRRFLARLIEQLDVAFGHRGTSPFLTSTDAIRQFTVITTNVSLDASLNQIILVDTSAGPVIVTLPEAHVVPGYRYIIKKIDTTANEVTVAASSIDLIDGETSWIIATPYDSMSIVPYENTWSIV